MVLQVNTDVLDTVLLSLHPAEVKSSHEQYGGLTGADHDDPVEGGGGEPGGVPEE